MGLKKKSLKLTQIPICDLQKIPKSWVVSEHRLDICVHLRDLFESIPFRISLFAIEGNIKPDSGGRVPEGKDIPGIEEEEERPVRVTTVGYSYNPHAISILKTGIVFGCHWAENVVEEYDIDLSQF